MGVSANVQRPYEHLQTALALVQQDYESAVFAALAVEQHPNPSS